MGVDMNEARIRQTAWHLSKEFFDHAMPTLLKIERASRAEPEVMAGNEEADAKKQPTTPPIIMAAIRGQMIAADHVAAWMMSGNIPDLQAMTSGPLTDLKAALVEWEPLDITDAEPPTTAATSRATASRSTMTILRSRIPAQRRGRWRLNTSQRTNIFKAASSRRRTTSDPRRQPPGAFAALAGAEETPAASRLLATAPYRFP